MKTEIKDISHGKDRDEWTYDHDCTLKVKRTDDNGNSSETEEYGYMIQGKDCIYLNADKIYPAQRIPLLTEAQDIVGAINELFQGGSGGGDDSSPIIKPWVRPSDWPVLPTPDDNQVIFLVTEAYNTSPYCSISIRPLDKYAFPENNGAYPNGLTADIDWGDGHVSHGIYKSENQMEWTNPFGYNGEFKHLNSQKWNSSGNCYYDYTGSMNDGSAQKFWNSGGTKLNDGSMVFIVTVTVSDPQNVVVDFPLNGYALEMHIGKNINIDKCDATFQQAYLQHVKSFGWQPGKNKDKTMSSISNGVVYWNTNGIFSGTRVLRKIDSTEPFTEIPDNLLKSCFYIPEMDLSEVTSIGENAFSYCYNSGVYTFNLPKCTEIKKGAFNSFKVKFKIAAPMLEILHEGAFRDCYGIAEINAPKVKIISKGCFYNCCALQKIDAPELTKIEDEGFAYCNVLTYANMPKLEYLGASGFAYCYNLREADFPALTYAGSGSFLICNALEKVVYGEGVSLNNTGLSASVLWYDNPLLSGERPLDIQ